MSEANHGQPVPPRLWKPRWVRRHFPLSAWVSIGLGAVLFGTTRFTDFFFSSRSLHVYWLHATMVMPTLGLLAALWALIKRAIGGGVAGVVINLLAGMAALAADMQS